VAWLGHRAHLDPMAVLEALESVAEIVCRTKGETLVAPHSLVSAVLEILREADETDDLALVRRAVALQDAFLPYDIYGMETLLDSASRN